MIKIVDNTLTSFDGCLPSKGDLHTFCELLISIGVDMIEMSIPVYEKMEYLPKMGRYILNIHFPDEMLLYPGFYRYTCRQDDNVDGIIHEIQLNDTREIVKLRAQTRGREYRIIGLDDLLCGTFDKTMSEMNKNLANSKINFCPENSYGCASALAVQWLLNFGDDVTTSFAGVKNNAATEEVIMALRLQVRHKINRDLSKLPEITKIYEKITGTTIGNKKPIIGKNIFKVEAGIHADGLKKNPATYEAFEPSLVGCKSEIVIGKHSGTKSIKLKLEEMDFPIPNDEIIEKILNEVKRICTENRKSLRDDEFIGLVTEVIEIEGV
ncbi:MAG: hypothetical protein K0S41_1158 [Anaerocolumna sp.]|nr:hypothetical protein [Anaerocolumna sp.]